MIAARRPTDTSQPTSSSEAGEVTYRFQVRPLPPQKPAAARAQRPAGPQPKQFDWFVLLLYVLLGLGILLIAGLFYAVFFSTPLVLPQ